MPNMNPAMGTPGMGKDVIKDNMSIFNPTDASMMKQQGGFTEDMTVRDVLGKVGIDVDGPATQLMDFAKKQTQNASPLGKMQSIAGNRGEGNMPPTGMPPAPPTPPGGGLDDLINQTRR